MSLPLRDLPSCPARGCPHPYAVWGFSCHSQTLQMGVYHLSGLFVLLCLGLGSALLTSLGEHIFYRLVLPRIRRGNKLQYWLHTSQVRRQDKVGQGGGHLRSLPKHLSVTLEDPQSPQHRATRGATGEGGAGAQVSTGRSRVLGLAGGQAVLPPPLLLSVLVAPKKSCLQPMVRGAGGGCAGPWNGNGACVSCWNLGRLAGTVHGSALMGPGCKRNCGSWSCALRLHGNGCAMRCCGEGSFGLCLGMAPGSGHCACCMRRPPKAEELHGRTVHDSLFYIQTRLCTLQLNSVERAPRILSRHLLVRARALGPARAPCGRHWGAPGGRWPRAHRSPIPAASRTFATSPSPCRPQLSRAWAAAPLGAGHDTGLRTRQGQVRPPEGPQGQIVSCPGH